MPPLPKNLGQNLQTDSVKLIIHIMILFTKKVKTISIKVLIKYDGKISQTFYVQIQRTSWRLICPAMCQTLCWMLGIKPLQIQL